MDSRADVYALGASSSSASPASLRSAARRPSPPSGRTCTRGLRRPRCAGPSSPAEIDDVLAQALAKSPAERHATCAELLWAARAALGVTQPGTAVEPALRPHQRALVDHCRSVLETLLEGRVVPGARDGGERWPCPAAISTLDDLRPPESTSPPHLAARFGYPQADHVELPRVSQYVAVTHGDGPLWDELHDVLDADYAPRRAQGSSRRCLGCFGPAAARSSSSRPGTTRPSSGRSTRPTRRPTSSGTSRQGETAGRFWHRAPDGNTALIEIPTPTRTLSPEKRYGRAQAPAAWTDARAGSARTSSSPRTTTSATWTGRPGRSRSRRGPPAAQPLALPRLRRPRLEPARAPAAPLGRRDRSLSLAGPCWPSPTGSSGSTGPAGGRGLDAPLHQYLDVLQRTAARKTRGRAMGTPARTASPSGRTARTGPRAVRRRRARRAALLRPRGRARGDRREPAWPRR